MDRVLVRLSYRSLPAPARSSTCPRRRSLAGPAAQARARLTRLLAFGDAADPLQVISVPPMYMDIIVAEAAGAIEEERCADDCVILACAYAHLGIAAEIRAATLTVTDTRDRSITAHGTLTPCCTATPSRGSPPSGA
jgi:hypothetical protein